MMFNDSLSYDCISKPSDHIWWMVSGYSSSKRVRKPLAFLHAYIDDSSSDKGDQRLFMAGYVNNAKKWALFSDAWDEELKCNPAISYLKMSEAKALQGQFRGWNPNERDEKIRGFIRVIRHFEPFSFHFSVSRSDFRNMLKPIAPRSLSNAHFTGCFGIVSMVTRHLAEEGIDVPIDFIFDEQKGVDADIHLLFEQMSKNLPKKARKLISGTPVFRNDKDLVPLQAADMLAWHIRREHETCGPNQSLENADLLRCEYGHLISGVDKHHVAHWATKIEQMPGALQLRSKSQWSKFRRNLSNSISAGYIPPFGSRRKNFVYGTIKRIRGFFRR